MHLITWVLGPREGLHGNMSLFINCIMVVDVTHFTDVTTPSLSTSSPLHTPPKKRAQACLSQLSSSPLPSSSTSVSPTVPTTSPVLSCYTDFLRAVYSTCPVAKSDKFPPTPSTVFIKLALVKKKKVSQAQADNFTRLTLRGPNLTSQGAN